MIAAVTLGMVTALAIASLAGARGSIAGRLVAVQLAGVITVHITLVLSLRSEISYYADVAVLAALVTFVSGLLFARFLERWL